MAGNFDISKFTKEQLNKAMECKTVDELIAFAKENGIELTKEQAEKYLAQLTGVDMPLSDEDMGKVAGGDPCSGYCIYDKW